MLLVLTEFASVNTKTGSRYEVEWLTLAKKLAKPYKSEFTREQFTSMSKDAQAIEKNKSHGAVYGESLDGHKTKASIPLRCAITLDYDEPDADIVDRVKNACSGFACVLYSTINSTKSHPRVRVIIPTNRLINPDEHNAVGRLIADRIGTNGIDNSCLQQWRMMLYPAVLSDQEYIYWFNDKQILDVNEWLDKYADWRDVSAWPTFPDEKKKLKVAKQRAERNEPVVIGDPREKHGIIGAFCRCYSITQAMKQFLPGIYEAGDNGRYTYTKGSSRNGVAIFDDKLLYSFHDTDPAGMMMLNAYDLVRIHKFGDRDKADKDYADQNRRPSNVSMVSLCRADKAVSDALRVEKAQAMATGISDEEVNLAVAMHFDTLPITDVGTAKRVAAFCGNTVRYDRDTGVWYQYKDGQFIKEQDCTFLYPIIEKVADMTAEAWVRSDRDLTPEMQKYQAYAQTGRNQNSIVKNAQYLLSANSDEFDADDESINLSDGYMSLEDGTWVEHNPAQLCRLKAGAQVNGEIDPECITFIESVLPDEELRDYVQRLCGYMLGRNFEQKLVIFYGKRGNNGKSTFSNLIEASMGDYCKTGSIDSILTAKGDGDSERANSSIARLKGSRVCVMHENDYSRSIRSSAVKRITGNTKILARFQYENFSEFLPKFTAVIDVNDAPTLQDAGDDAMKKRVRIIPFTAHFSGPQVDRTIEKKVWTKEWKNTYLMWALEGREKYRKYGLDNYDGTTAINFSDLPKLMKEAMSDYFEMSDDVGEYIASCLDITNDRNDFVSVKELYDDYCRWVVGTPRGSNAFAQQLKCRFAESGIEQSSRRNDLKVLVRGYAGVKKISTTGDMSQYYDPDIKVV